MKETLKETSQETFKETALKKRFYALFCAIVAAAFLTCCFAAGALAEELPQDEPEALELQKAQEAQNTEETEATLLFVGDLMAHMPQITGAKRGRGYDFSRSFSAVAPIISAADFAVANFETTLGGTKRGYSGYPCFSAPDAFARAVCGAGFDAVSTANNHSLDKGFSGAVRTLAVLRGLGLATFGTRASEADDVLIVDVNGIKIAFLSWTYGTNGINPPEGKSWAIPYTTDAEIEAAMARARDLKPDFIVAMPHFGVEYSTEPSAATVKLAEMLIAEGADAVLLSHPHVVQAFELRESRHDATRKLIAWSLGNFISNQRDEPRDVGVMLRFRLKKDESLTEIVSAEVIPTWVQKFTAGGKMVHRVLPITEALAAQKKFEISCKDLDRLRRAHLDFTKRILGEDVPIENAAESYKILPRENPLYSARRTPAPRPAKKQ